MRNIFNWTGTKIKSFHMPECFKLDEEAFAKGEVRIVEFDRRDYRTRISNLVAAIQAAAIEGFALRCVAAGSMWATFELTSEEVAKLQQHKFFLEEDK